MSQLRLEDREWKPFEIGRVFDLHATRSGIDKNKIIEGDEIAYITRSDKSNGLSGVIASEQQEKYKLEKGNTLTIGADTQTVFYHPYNFFTGEKVHSLKQKHLNRFTSFFLIPLIRRQLSKFAWGHLASIYRLTKQRIMLPVNSDGKPDWQFMEDYSKHIYQHKKEELKAYQKAKLRKLVYRDIPPLKEKEWKPFVLNDIFVIKGGQDITYKGKMKGDTPYVSSSDKCNGVVDFVGNKNSSIAKDFMSVNRNGSVCHSYYHPYTALVSNDCRRLFFKHKRLQNSFLGQFLKVSIYLQKAKYSWGYKMGTAKLKRQRIMLPVGSDGEPDFPYMSQYMQNVEYKKLKAVEGV